MVTDPLEFTAAVDRYLAAIEALRTGPYAPPWAGCADAGRSASGDDFAIVALRVSQDFYEDDGEALDAVNEEFATECWGVVLALDERWGKHGTLSMEEYADREAEGRPMPPFFAALCELGYFGDLQVWDVAERRVAVGVGQMDQEEPVVLFAAVTGSAAR
jgi:hypothetical protein